MTNYRLCRVSDVPVGEMKQVTIEDRELLVINQDNHFICTDARCTHAGAPLAEGELNGNILTCPWHRSQFDITNGSVVKGPAKKPLRVFRL